MDLVNVFVDLEDGTVTHMASLKSVEMEHGLTGVILNAFAIEMNQKKICRSPSWHLQI